MNLEDIIDRAILVLIVVFLVLGSVFFATKAFSATPPLSFKGELSQNFLCKNISEADVLKDMGEGLVLRGTSLDAFLRSLAELSGQPAPDMDTLRVYPVPNQPVHMIVAIQQGCVVGAVFIPNQVIAQLLRRAGV